MKKFLLIAVAAMTVLAGCNTVKGAAQDVQKVGTKVEQSAERHGAE
ncbi:small secreted protein [Paralysiella testudinis]|uniref:Small secreted protein n=1 Tax=Paralysiella testudinis TaxID=2809020 RepID=A0A892ZG21_9NEIS|nr:small secreted protein [Paralysiella testudinis]QRQ80686.1 small secreted protein [Paralysiella testudinis]